LYITEERYDEAREHLSRAAELGLNTASLYGSLGFLNQTTDNPWGAVNAFQQAMMLDGENEQWQRGLLNALNQSRNYPSALALVEQLLRKHPNDADLWVYRAFMAQSTDDDATALASLETAIRLGHDSVSNLQVCATLHMQIGSVGRATELLGLGFVDGMDYMFVDQALAWLTRQSEWDFAAQLADDARPRLDELNDNQRSRFLTRDASIDLHNGQTDEALQQLEESLELDPSNADALMALAELYKDNGNLGQAELLFQRASAFDATREGAWMSMAQLAIDQNQYERALDLLRQTVELNPRRTDLRRNIEILENLVQLRGGI
jgi:tetratricopeptide (TPR) repeat protein